MTSSSSRLRRAAMIVTLALALVGTADATDYRLDSGDVLEIQVFGIADFQRHVAVNVDGDVSVPIIGEVRARGLSLAELRKAMAAKLAESGTIRSPDVTIQLVEHRPFYISGDVAKPGGYPYRPDMTVRIAVALAGGYDALRFRTDNPLLMAPDLQSRYQALWTDLVREQARVSSLKAEIDGKTAVDLSELREAPLPEGVVAEIVALEGRDLQLRVADFIKQKSFLSAAIAEDDGGIRSLETALAQQNAIIDRQTATSEKAGANFSRGLTSSARMEEENRALATLRNTQTDLSMRLVQTRQARDDLQRQLGKAADDRQRKLVQDLQDATVQLEKTRADIRATGDKMLYAGALKTQMKDGAVRPEVTIYRRAEDGSRSRVAADEDAAVLPGDVVEVLIRTDQVLRTGTN